MSPRDTRRSKSKSAMVSFCQVRLGRRPLLTRSVATSNDPWGPTGTDMADIAKITYNRSAPSDTRRL
jgi:hypothetical protein